MNTPPPKGGPAMAQNMYLVATAFHYKKYPSYEEALQAGLDLESIKTPEDLIERASTARDPYQYISKVVTLAAESTKVSPDQLPITQDVSASAYQIISYFMLDFQLAKYTNLIPTKVRNSEHLRINDIYDFFLSELIEYLKTAGNIIFKDGSIIIKYVCPLLHRNLVKSLLMPLVYGKTAYSISDNLYNELNILLGKKECLELARHIEIFFKKRFPHIVNLMSLIRAVGWVVSASGAPVYYSTHVFTTVQDYMKSEAVNIWLYDRQSKKRRQVTLRVPTPERDRRKTTSAIFANFIHQKDAIIAFNMIKNVKKRGIPIYTVHDNFITTMDFSHAMGESYFEILLNSPHPMEYINSFLAINLFDEARTPGGLCQIDLDGCFAVDELHSRLYNIPCPK
ncbi:hypothetical protein KY284_017827 [Solanum tuberosum]|nr:hypothetical protein KY284_017827 [Solanum tuberosum]